MPLPRSRSYIGIAKEATHLVPTAPTGVAATDFIPVRTFNPTDHLKYLEDKGWRGSMVEDYNQIPSNLYSELDINGDVFPDTIGYIFGGVLGDYQSTAASAPFTHTFSVLNSSANYSQPTSYSITDYDAYEARQFAGTQFSDIDVKFNADGLLEYTAKGVGYGSSVITAPTPSFSTLPPDAAWIGVATIGGTVQSNLATGNLNISRPVTPIFTVDGSQNPYRVFSGMVKCEGALTLIFEDDTNLNQYLTNAQPSLDLNFQQGAGAALTQVKLHATKAAFVTGKIERGKEYVELAVGFKCIANTTDVGTSGGYSPVRVTLQNAKALGTFA